MNFYAAQIYDLKSDGKLKFINSPTYVTFAYMQVWIEKYLIETNIWVSICFTALLAFFQLVLYELNFPVLGIAFFGTLTIYNFTRINRDDLQSFSIQSEHILLTIIGSILTIICVILRGFDIKTFLYLGVLGMISFSYSLPFKGLGLRAIPFLKLFLIAFVWAGSSIGLLLIVHHDFIHYEFLFVSVIFFVIGITIPFDIRDENCDEKELKTIPQVIGNEKAKSLAGCCLVLSGLLFFFEFLTLSIPVIAWLITIFVAMLFVLNSNQKRENFYYAFWTESCSLLPLLIYKILIFH